MNGKNYTFHKSIPCSFGRRPMTTTTKANRWQNVFHSSSYAITECLNGILGHTRSKCLRETNNWARFFKCTVFFLEANYMFPINFLNYKADSMKWFGMRCNSQIDRIESGSVILSALRLNFLAASLSLSIANNDVFM